MQSAGLSRFENKRILIVGDIMLDEFIFSGSSGFSSEYKDVPVLRVKEKKQYLGGAANVALNIKKLKAIPYLVGTVGNDESAETILHLLNRESITPQYIFHHHRQVSTRKSRLFEDGKVILRMDEENKGPYEQLVYDFLLKNIIDAITDHKPHAIILQDYNKGVLSPALIKEILSLAKKHAILVGVDPKFENWELYQEADLFKPNKKEFLFMSESENESEHKVEAEQITLKAKTLQDKIHFKNLIVTLGAEGNFIYNNSISQLLPLTSQLSHPDVCGAGDTVIAVATLALACGSSLEEIAQLSNKAGYLVCGKEHIQPVTLEELEN